MPRPQNSSPLAEAYFHDSVGKTLKRRRQELELTLEQVARETKIQRKYLKAMEAGEWANLPHTVHMLGFVRQYASLMGLDGQVAATKYLLERGPLLKSAGKPRRPRLKSPIVGSRLMLRLGIGMLLLGVVVYLGLQLSILAAPPPLNITEPAADIQTAAQTITVSGETDPSASVTVNGSAVAVNDEGKFATSLNLVDGLNVIKIEARNRAGKVAELQRSILVRD